MVDDFSSSSAHFINGGIVDHSVSCSPMVDDCQMPSPSRDPCGSCTQPTAKSSRCGHSASWTSSAGGLTLLSKSIEPRVCKSLERASFPLHTHSSSSYVCGPPLRLCILQTILQTTSLINTSIPRNSRNHGQSRRLHPKRRAGRGRSRQEGQHRQ